MGDFRSGEDSQCPYALLTRLLETPLDETLFIILQGAEHISLFSKPYRLPAHGAALCPKSHWLSPRRFSRVWNNHDCPRINGLAGSAVC